MRFKDEVQEPLTEMEEESINSFSRAESPLKDPIDSYDRTPASNYNEEPII